MPLSELEKRGLNAILDEKIKASETASQEALERSRDESQSAGFRNSNYGSHQYHRGAYEALREIRRQMTGLI